VAAEGFDPPTKAISYADFLLRLMNLFVSSLSLHGFLTNGSLSTAFALSPGETCQYRMTDWTLSQPPSSMIPLKSRFA
jgi:hypothetical protein